MDSWTGLANLSSSVKSCLEKQTSKTRKRMVLNGNIIWGSPLTATCMYKHINTHIHAQILKKPWKQFLKTVCGIWEAIPHSSCYVFKTIILEMGCVEKLGSCSSERSEWNRIIFKPTHMARGLPDLWCKFSVSSIRKGTSFFAVWGIM